MNSEILEIEACRRVLGLGLPEDLPGIGVRALEAGCDSPSLRILAGLSRSEHDEAKSNFARAMSELRLEFPFPREAARRLSLQAAKRILVGTVQPIDGAREVCRIMRRLHGEHLHEFDTFLYAESEWDERPDDHPMFEEGIIAAARDLMT